MSKFSLILKTFLLFLFVFVLVACQPMPMPATNMDTQAESAISAKPLKIGHSTWVGYGPLYIARDKGFFEEENVEVELIIVEDAKSRFAALAAGQLDGMAVTLDTMTLYWKQNNQFAAVMGIDDSNGGDGVVSNQDIETVADLKGKKVGFSEGSTSHFFISYLLDLAGLSLDDIEAINMTPGDAGAAFVAQQVDAAVTWEPWLTRGKQATHGKILADTSSSPSLIVDVLLFDQEVIETRGDDIQAIIRAYNKAISFWRENPDEGVAIMAAGVGGWLEDPAEFEATLAGVTLLGQAENASFFDGKAQETLSFAIDFWRNQGLITEEFVAEDLINDSFLEK